MRTCFRRLAPRLTAIGIAIAITASTAIFANAQTITEIYSPASNTTSLYYLSSDQHIQQIWMGSSGGWNHVDFTGYMGAPVAAPNSTLASVYNPINSAGPTTEVYYIGTNQHIYQFWLLNNLWHYSDLTAYVGAPNAANGSAITAVYSPISGTTSIYYLSSDQHVQQIWMGTTGGWNHDDFTAYVGAPPAAAGSSLEAFYNPVNPLGPTTEVYYVGTNQHVYQFWLGQGSWQSVTFRLTLERQAQ